MTVTIVVDGRDVEAVDGMMLTAALIGSGHRMTGTHPVTGSLRGPFCGIGICLECEVAIDGRSAQRACLTRVRPGMQIETGAGAAGQGPRSDTTIEAVRP